MVIPQGMYNLPVENKVQCKSHCTAHFMSLISVTSTDLHNVCLISNMPQCTRTMSIHHLPYSTSGHKAYSSHYISILSSSPPPVQVPTGYWSFDWCIWPDCHHCCPCCLLLLLLLLLVAIATSSEINNGTLYT